MPLPPGIRDQDEYHDRLRWVAFVANEEDVHAVALMTLGFGVVIALLIMLASLAWFRIGDLNSEVTMMVKDRYPKTVIANKIKADLNEITRNMLSVLIMTDPGQIKKELQNAKT